MKYLIRRHAQSHLEIRSLQMLNGFNNLNVKTSNLSDHIEKKEKHTYMTEIRHLKSFTILNTLVIFITVRFKYCNRIKPCFFNTFCGCHHIIIVTRGNGIKKFTVTSNLRIRMLDKKMLPEPA